MSTELLRRGNYGAYSPSGSPIGLSPAMLESLIISPQIRSMIAGGRVPPDANQLSGILNWANSQANSSRAITPTVPGLSLPPQIQAIMSQASPLSVKANQLPGTVTGGPQVDATTGQFGPGGQAAGSPTSQAPTAGATGQASPSFVQQIVAQAVAAVMGDTNSGNVGGSAGPSAGGPGPGGGTDPGGIGGSGGSSAGGGGAMEPGGGGLGGDVGGQGTGGGGGTY